MLYIQGLASRGPLAELLRQPATASQPLSDLADLDAAGRYVRLRAISMWHPAGTCTMLPRGKRGVVDASVVPLLPLGNLLSTVYGVVEKATAMIKVDYGLK